MQCRFFSVIGLLWLSCAAASSISGKQLIHSRNLRAGETKATEGRAPPSFFQLQSAPSGQPWGGQIFAQYPQAPMQPMMQPPMMQQPMMQPMMQPMAQQPMAQQEASMPQQELAAMESDLKGQEARLSQEMMFVQQRVGEAQRLEGQLSSPPSMQLLQQYPQAQPVWPNAALQRYPQPQGFQQGIPQGAFIQQAPQSAGWPVQQAPLQPTGMGAFSASQIPAMQPMMEPMMGPPMAQFAGQAPLGQYPSQWP